MYTETSLLELLKQEDSFIDEVNSWNCNIKRNEEKLKSSKKASAIKSEHTLRR